MKPEQKQGKFSKFFLRLTREGLLKAFLVALTAGFAVSFVVAAAMWIIGMNALWICIAIVTGFVLLGIPVLYLSVFRPTVKSNAKRIDRLGLEERMITMVELENDDSVLTRLQREDARKHLEATDEKQMKIHVPRRMVTFVSVAAILGCTMTTLSTLAALGYIMSGAELLDPLIPDPPVQYVYVEYIVEEGGYIEGEELQEIILGESGSQVLAVAEDGWLFIGWEDGNKHPDRIDTNVQQDMVMIAVFEPSMEDQEGDGNGDQDGQDTPKDAPSDPQKGKGQQDDESDQTNPEGSGGKYEPASQIINGETYYRDVLDQYLDIVEEHLASGEEIPEEIRKIIESYTEIIG